MAGTLAERFWEKVVVHEGACWEWLGSALPEGYGRMNAPREGRKHRSTLATHVSWFLRYGVWPRMLLHSCDNPPCTNWDHLYEGDHFRNQHDLMERHGIWQNRVTHCPKGHPYNEENTRRNNGRRSCRACARARNEKARPYITDFWLLFCACCGKEFKIWGVRYRHRLRKGQRDFCCSHACSGKFWGSRPRAIKMKTN